MSSWRPFGYEGREETCLWCGGKLRRATVLDEDRERELRAEGKTYAQAYDGALVRADKTGPYQDGFFDTKSCGFQFGVRMAGLGHRLQLPAPGGS